MSDTYKIINYSTIFPMIFSFCKENDKENIITINVNVDYFNHKVYFGDNISKHPEIDFLKLENQIFQSLEPEEIEIPEVSGEILEKASKIKEPNYTESFLNMTGADYDSR